MGTDESPIIYHIARREDWQDAVRLGIYAPSSLPVEGFIHCSTFSQILETANRWFRGRADLLLLEIDARLITAELKREPPLSPADERRAERFPHLYGPLNLDAVAQVLDFPCEADASFRLPPNLRVQT